MKSPIRILAVDGGGVGGIIPARVLERLATVPSEEFGGRLTLRRVHSHVKRTVTAKAETTFGPVKLHGGNAEVGDNSIHLFKTLFGYDPTNI